MKRSRIPFLTAFLGTACFPLAATSQTLAANGVGQPRAIKDVTAVIGCGACESLMAFEHEAYPHAFPVAEAEAFRRAPGANGALVAMLSKTSERPHWMNAVLTLGITGASDEVRFLEGFLVRQSDSAGDDLTHAEYLARTNVPIALGFLANESRGTDAAALSVDYLADGLRPDGWVNALRWRSAFDATDKERNLYLIFKTAQGLALSASPRALTALRDLQDNLRSIATAIEFGRPDGHMRGWRKDLSASDVVQLQDALGRCLNVWSELQRASLAEYYQ